MSDGATRQMPVTDAAQGRLVVVAAPSGTGKTSLTRALIERLRAQGRAASFSVSYTTRAPRPGERDGVDYHFVDVECFNHMRAQGDFLECAQVFDRQYGTGRAVTQAALARGECLFLDIDWQGAQQVRASFAASLHIFLKPPSLAELERRLRSRGQDDAATIASRMAQARTELAHADEFAHVLVNDDFALTLARMEAIVLGHG